ncbi:uncharacterized protein YkwD [Mycoplana sp. BE70]|uniref:CAP domain-containing protein n=1 Tax=Mycoplana sp. BE70 TaxID=2817775 RepID=UPI002865B58C|nr:CAP domain-containing protein [Mycoplana sp. BE70]MDR6754911.1 uncharacterized protein YkwD [Mycoplana sp. BE70]
MTSTTTKPLGRRAVLGATLGAFAATVAGCTTTDKIDTGANASDQTDATLAMINKLRRERGLEPLSRHPASARAAVDQARRMASAGKMEHNIGLGANFAKRMKGMEVPLPAAENIAVGQADAARAFQAWVDSPKHLANMLGPGYRGLGVAEARNTSSGYRPYWAMVLSS